MQKFLFLVSAVACMALLSVGCGDIAIPNQPNPPQKCVPTCPTTQTCFQGTCCTPNCERPDGTQKECGGDGCGGICGSCPSNQDCGGNGVCKAPL